MSLRGLLFLGGGREVVDLGKKELVGREWEEWREGRLQSVRM